MMAGEEPDGAEEVEGQSTAEDPEVCATDRGMTDKCEAKD